MMGTSESQNHFYPPADVIKPGQNALASSGQKEKQEPRMMVD
jgi:hypothetical protein